MTVRVKTYKSALSLSHRDAGHRERGEENRILVRVGVGGGGQFMLGLLRVSQDRCGVSQDDVLSGWGGLTDLSTEGCAANQSYDLWEPMMGENERVKEEKYFFKARRGGREHGLKQTEGCRLIRTWSLTLWTRAKVKIQLVYMQETEGSYFFTKI